MKPNPILVIEFTKKLYKNIFSDYFDEFETLENIYEFVHKCLPFSQIEFLNLVEKIKNKLSKDIEFYLVSDPATTLKEEIILASLPFFAIYSYRLAHELKNSKCEITPRIISTYAQSKTAIDIHPDALIGAPFFIDHGFGIVIGQTSVIGNYVKLYHGVTLGAISTNPKYLSKFTKRHPTIKDNVTIYANASILGGNTIIGKNQVIPLGAIIKNSLPDK